MPCTDFPRGPVLFVFGKVFQTFVRSWEPLQRQHGIGRNEEEGFRRDWISCSIGLFLLILECVNVHGFGLGPDHFCGVV